MSNGINFRELALDLRRQLTATQAELSATKAQEPVAFVHFCDSEIDYDSAYVISNEPGDCVDDRHEWRPVYAAPVSEAKAQGVVMLPSVAEVMNIVFDYQHNKNKNVTGTTNWAANIGMAVIDAVVRLNAAPVQQVSVPDERAAFEREDRYIVIKRSDMDRIPNQKVVHSFLGALGELSAHSVRIPQRKFLVIESDWPEYDPAWKLIQDRVQGRPILDAAPAAPAADAPPENCRQLLAAEGKPYPRSSCTVCGKFSPKWRECDAALAAYRAQGVV